MQKHIDIIQETNFTNMTLVVTKKFLTCNTNDAYLIMAGKDEIWSYYL